MINFYGAGNISTMKRIRGKSPYFLITLTDNSETQIVLHVPYSFNKIIKLNERVIFEGYLNEEGIVETKEISRAYLEPLGFNFLSDNEDVFSFSSKGLVLKVDVKAPKYNIKYKTFGFLAKAGNVEVFNRLVGVLNNKKVSLKGVFKNNVGMITALDKVL